MSYICLGIFWLFCRWELGMHCSPFTHFCISWVGPYTRVCEALEIEGWCSKIGRMYVLTQVCENSS